MKEKFAAGIWFCPACFDTSTDCDYPYFSLLLPQVQFDFTSDVFNYGITLVLSLVCFGVDYLLHHIQQPQGLNHQERGNQPSIEEHGEENHHEKN